MIYQDIGLQMRAKLLISLTDTEMKNTKVNMLHLGVKITNQGANSLVKCCNDNRKERPFAI